MSESKKYPIMLVGTGPGNPDLLTVKADKAIREADVLLYDCMLAQYLMALKRPDAQVIYLCKSPDNPAVQVKVHNNNVIDHLAHYYHAGKRVVRLKAGDAFMFGGGGHEVELLKKRGLAFEVVPGLTAGAVAANHYGISISEKDECDTVIYYIAYHINDNYQQIRQFAQLLNMGATVVLYMADDNLPTIIEVLKAEGVSGHLPAAVVGMASLPDEDCADATLDTIIRTAKQQDMLMPFTYFIGQHVKRFVDQPNKMPKQLSFALEEEPHLSGRSSPVSTL